MALLRTLVSDSEENRMLLTAVTAVRVGRELHNRLTGQDKIDAYKVIWLQPAGGAVECGLFRMVCEFSDGQLPMCVCVPPQQDCVLSIAQFLQTHPRASQADINAQVEKMVLLFAARVKALEKAPLF